MVWAKGANSLKPRVDLAELAGSEEILSNCEESVNLYIALKCCIMPRGKYNYENIPKVITWGEGTLIDLSYPEMFCKVPRHNAIWLQIYVDVLNYLVYFLS